MESQKSPNTGVGTSTLKKCHTVLISLSRVSIHDHRPGDEPVDDDAVDTSSMGIPLLTAGDQTPSVPLQISQLAHILYDTLIQDPEFNDPILELL